MQEGEEKGKDFEDNKALAALANLVIESLEEKHETDWEVVELYAQKLRTHIHGDPTTFHQRFVNGYRALLDTLKQS